MKDINHRRKCKKAKIAEELDFDKLARELKRNNKSKPKYNGKGKDYKNKNNKNNNRNNNNKSKKYPNNKKDK